MNRRIIAPRLFWAGLAGAVSFLSLLPSLGWIWHRVLPEHEHLFVGTVHEDLRVPSTFVADDCGECAPGETLLHLPGLGAFQIAALAMCTTQTLRLPIPHETITRVLAQFLNLTAPLIPQLCPPPKSA